MRRIATLLPLALLTAAVASPGVVYELETTDHTGDEPLTETVQMMIEGSNVAIPFIGGAESGGRGAMIFRGGEGEHGEMIIVDHERRSYVVMSEDMMKDVAEQMNSAMAEMDKMMASLPKAQREMLEKARREAGAAGMPGSSPAGGASRPEVEVRETGERDNMHGYPVRKFEVYHDGVLAREVWTTPWDEVEGGDEARAAFERMGEFYTAVMSSLPTLPGAEVGTDNPFEEMNFGNGMPVLTREYGSDGELQVESVLTSAHRQTLDASVFEPPAGYERMSMGPG